MFLRRLSIKGFKSFADATVLEFEPGVTVVVGPNGSGKSNVVDATMWVLGAQGTRALRSQKMEDVIFAGTASRPALGRAEVTLTIDNASGRLPVDLAEVTITRTLFRNGESEYAINGAPCRLLDVQELLSDSGVGRQHHMIIGQGQLDQVLNARPEDRRAIIEEAAGVLKHRRRKERAERRLAATQENLERLGDLVREVRRQMRPLERQAAAARAHAVLAADLAAVRRHLYALELDGLSVREREVTDELRELDTDVRSLRLRTRNLDVQATSAAAELSSRREEELAQSIGELQGLQGRLRGTAGVLSERRRAVEAALEASADENVVASLESDAARLANELDGVALRRKSFDVDRAEVADAQAALDAQRREYDATWGAKDGIDAVGALDRARDRRTLLERAITVRTAATTDLTERRNRTAQRLAELTGHAGEVAARLRDAEDAHVTSDAVAITASATVQAARATASSAEGEWRSRHEVAARSQARAEALERALSELTGAGGREALGDLGGVLGALVDLVEIDPGFERAVEAAIGASLAAVVVDSGPTARRALERFQTQGAAGLVLPATRPGAHRGVDTPGATPLRSVVRARRGVAGDVDGALDRLLATACCTESLDAAVELALERPDLIVVTTSGDRLASSGWRAAAGAPLVTRDLVLAAAAQAVRDAELAEQAHAALLAARGGLDTAGASAVEANRMVEAARADAAACTSELARIESERQVREREVGELELRITDTRTAARDEEEDLAAVDAALPGLEDASSRAVEQSGWAAQARESLDAKEAQVRELGNALALTEASLEERAAVLESRLTDVERRLSGHAIEREEASLRRRQLESDVAALDSLSELVASMTTRVDVAHDVTTQDYRAQLDAARAGGARLEAIRRERSDAEIALTEAADRERDLEVEATAIAARLESLADAVRRELGIELPGVPGAPCPDLGDAATPAAREAALAAELDGLGPINPLALEELSGLEVRHHELDTQVADVRTAKRELQEVVRTLDEEIMSTFSTAAADVNEHFSDLVATLFPGGQGRLTLTEPDDLLHTGVEVEVRPLGRNVRRVSLLSGGERSLAALAFLFAVFRSRPSPFYLMDEVEAALDDVNLHRFLGLIDEFRNEAQLVIVSHQKRTMEAADALYGVTMAPGGSSQVVSQKVERTAATT